MRRILLALTVSLAAHAGVVAVATGVGLWRALSLVPAVKLQPIAIDVVKDLPLGAPPDKQPVAADEPPPVRVRKPRVRVVSARDGVTIPSAPDAGAPDSKSDAAVLAKAAPRDGGGSIDGGRRRPGDLRSNGPDGSRLIALLRLDRLRVSPDSDSTIAAVDRLLLLLPDRHRLIDGTGLDLYRDFDSLLIATPNPTDDAVTFLAARHHLMDAALKAALDRGAKAARKPIAWRTIEGRPVGIRQQDKGAALDRDDRILALPMPALAIMATPAYAVQMLGQDALAPPNTARAIDAGSADADASSKEPRKPSGRPSWREIAARIEAEDGAMPDDAAFMMTATNLFDAAAGESYVVPSTRGANDDSPPQPLGTDPGPVPQTLTLVVGAETPFIEVLAEFRTAADADRWERDLPAWKRKVISNPAVFLSGFSSLISRAQTTREENTLQTRIDVSTAELQRLLNLAANLTRSALGHPR